ncbi:MAG: PEP-CTERM sorting domain-containing protein [Phycisphaerae bacterium]
MTLGRRKTGILCLIIALWAFTAQGSIIYSFNIFDNSNWSENSQLNFTVTVSEEGQNQAGFLFENSSSISSSITAVYFDDDSLLSGTNETFLQGSGVAFSQGANPSHLPGGDTLTPEFAKPADFSADSDSKGGTSHNGINQGEWLKIIFTIENNRDFDDVINALSESKDLRIGLHIQSLSNGDSVSAINRSIPANTQIPEPAAIVLLTIGIVAFLRKK